MLRRPLVRVGNSPTQHSLFLRKPTVTVSVRGLFRKGNNKSTSNNNVSTTGFITVTNYNHPLPMASDQDLNHEAQRKSTEKHMIQYLCGIMDFRWESMWKGRLKGSDDWTVELLVAWDEQLVRWEVDSASRERRAAGTFDKKGLVDSGMHQRPKMKNLVHKLLELCVLGDLKISLDEDDLLTLIVMDQTHEIDYEFNLGNRYRNRSDIHDEYHTQPSVAVDTASEEVIAQLKAENQDILDKSAKMAEEIAESREKVRILVGKNDMLNAKILKLESRNDSSMDVGTINDDKSKEITNQDVHPSRAVVKEEIKVTVSDESSATKHSSSVPMSKMDEDLEILLSEHDEEGNPMFIVKLKDYKDSKNKRDELQFKYLFKNRKMVEANAKYAFKGTTRDVIRRQNALHFSAGRSVYSGIVQWLLDEGSIDPNERTEDKFKETALMKASTAGIYSSVKALLRDKRVDKDASDARGLTALMLSVMTDQSNVVKILLKYGCDPTLTDDYGRTATKIAKDQGNDEIAHILEKATHLWLEHKSQ